MDDEEMLMMMTITKTMKVNEVHDDNDHANNDGKLPMMKKIKLMKMKKVTMIKKKKVKMATMMKMR